jgi:hypothetical protein
MKLQNKLGIYAIISILLLVLGLIIAIYDFSFYEGLDVNIAGEDLNLFTIISVKSLGLLIIYAGIRLHSKHFKTKSW